MLAVTILGGVLAAVVFGLIFGTGEGELLGFPKILWLPFLVGAALANHLARWYSYRYPHRYSDPWAIEKAKMERERCIGSGKAPKV